MESPTRYSTVYSSIKAILQPKSINRILMGQSSIFRILKSYPPAFNTSFLFVKHVGEHKTSLFAMLCAVFLQLILQTSFDTLSPHNLSSSVKHCPNYERINVLHKSYLCSYVYQEILRISQYNPEGVYVSCKSFKPLCFYILHTCIHMEAYSKIVSCS